ncbi:hypothetical protein [Halobacillus sp. A5]|uniref:hypothetical protein n=1 Tax=Halobacillus sp. A5 TaxID=2880263 RepID=UPI0020A6C7DA|nr:hypothetical protein [Halobacillus sp. A5]MCP3026657.1 hypothetical protein [Halobacillus sp. A5]
MGYILPIQNYQYQDYQQRVTQNKQPSFTLDRVFKVTMDHKLKEYYTRGEQGQKGSQDLKDKLHTSKKFHYNKTTRAPEMEQKLYSELTGKGQQFSETI